MFEEDIELLVNQTASAFYQAEGFSGLMRVTSHAYLNHPPIEYARNMRHHSKKHKRGGRK